LTVAKRGSSVRGVEGHGQRRIIEFIAIFAEKPELIHQFRENPHHMLRDSGLTDAQKEIVSSGDLTRISEAIHGEGGLPQGAYCILVVFG
jgi:hypothetical protein